METKTIWFLLNVLQNIFCLRSEEQSKSYRFVMTREWVNDDTIFIFGWTIPLIALKNLSWLEEPYKTILLGGHIIL